MNYLACTILFVRNATVVLTYPCGADVPICSLYIASIVDYEEMNYRDFPQLMHIYLNLEQTKTFSFHFLTDIMFIIILQDYNL